MFGLENHTFTITATRTGPTTTSLDVNLSYSGTAVQGTDFLAVAPDSLSHVTIPAGSASGSITVRALDDADTDGPEKVVAQVASGTGYVIGTPSKAATLILEPHGPPHFVPDTTGSAPPDPVGTNPGVTGNVPALSDPDTGVRYGDGTVAESLPALGGGGGMFGLNPGSLRLLNSDGFGTSWDVIPYWSNDA